ncbi:hypothetical protein [Rhodococcus opacus]
MTTTPIPDAVPAPNTAEAASLYQRLRGHLAVMAAATVVSPRT